MGQFQYFMFLVYQYKMMVIVCRTIKWDFTDTAEEEYWTQTYSVSLF